MNLPAVIVYDILSLLPVKSLARFKVVCRDWYSQIHSKSFIARHMNNQIGKEKILIYHYNDLESHAVSICSGEEIQLQDGEEEEEEEGEGDDIPTLFNQSKQQQYFIQQMPLEHLKHDECAKANIIGTCNGIVCFASRDRTEERSEQVKFITLWNPTTREFNTLPPFQLQHPPGTCIYTDHVGFGFDCTTDDYKVIRIFYFEKEEVEQQEYIIQMGIYSLSTNSWREFDCSGLSARIIKLGKNSSMVFGNKFCWLARNYGDVEMNDERFILSFDMDKEVFQKIPLPSAYLQYVKYYCFAKLFDMHDSIALVLYAQMDRFVSLEIWTTKDLEQGPSWIKLLGVDQISGYMWPVGFWKCRNSDDLFLLFKGENENDMKGINMNNRGQIKSNRPMTIKVKNNSIEFPEQILTYLETLVSVNRS